MRNDLRDTFSYNAFATDYAKEKILKKVFDGFEEIPAGEKIEYLIKLNSPTKEYFNALFFTILRD